MGKILKWYEARLRFILSWVIEDVLMVERVVKFHRRFLEKALLLIMAVFAFIITFWFYDSRGFEWTVIFLLLGILLSVGKLVKNTKKED